MKNNENESVATKKHKPSGWTLQEGYLLWLSATQSKPLGTPDQTDATLPSTPRATGARGRKLVPLGNPHTD